MAVTKKQLLAFAILILAGIAYPKDTPLFSDEILKKHNIVDVQSLDPTIGVNLVYATEDNFLGRNVYGELKRCYLRREAADMLVRAQLLLKKKRPGYSLLVFDGLRPRRIQQLMWDIVRGTDQQQYVTNPKFGSMHNYGAAVDLTIADETGKPLDMGTPYDHFGPKAQPRYENIFLHPGLLKKSGLGRAIRKQIEDEIKKYGPLTPSEVENRLLLRNVMEQAGFQSLMNEWWHFNAFPNHEARKKFAIVE